MVSLFKGIVSIYSDCLDRDSERYFKFVIKFWNATESTFAQSQNRIDTARSKSNGEQKLFHTTDQRSN